MGLLFYDMSSRCAAPRSRPIGLAMYASMCLSEQDRFDAAVTRAVRGANAFNRGIRLVVERSMEGGMCVFYKAVGDDAGDG